MNQREIRENCYECGHRCLLLMKPATMPTDFCDAADMECSLVTYCDLSMRVPKIKQTKYKKAMKDV